MGEFKLSPQALSDIEEIWEYIANDMPRTVCAMRSLVLATNLRTFREWAIFEPIWPMSLFVSGQCIRI